MNYLLAVMEAVSYSVATGSNQQLTDSTTTTQNVGIEQTEYNDWTATIQKDQAAINLAAYNLEHNPNNQSCQAALTQAQTQFQNDETQEQTYTQQADSATQAMQNQAGQDSSTMQQKVQLEAAVNQVAQTLASALGQHY